MKSFILITFIIVVLISCSKNISSSKSVHVNNNNLSGTWLLKKYEGGFGYELIIPKDIVTITFKQSGEFISSANFTLPPAGNYSITKDPNGYHYSDTVVNFTANNWQRIIYGVKLKTDSLFLFDGCCDMYEYTYVRIK